MSRQPFSSILRNAQELLDDNDENLDGEAANDDEGFCDTEGHSVYEWVNCAEVGWDEPLQTYFLQAIEMDDGPVWWFGTVPRELPTFEALCGAINSAFRDNVKFDFVDTIEKT